jgi:hypothetical protein
VLFFRLGIKDKKSLAFSAVFFTLSMISYYAGQVIVPLFVMGLFCIYWRDLLHILKSDKRMRIFLVAYGIFLIPIVWNIFSPASLIRFRGTSTFAPDAHPEEYKSLVLLRNKAVVDHNMLGSIVYNRRLFPVRVFLEGYVSHLNPTWLFFNSSKEPFKVPNMGLLYLWEIPFILLGVLAVILGKELDSRSKKLIFLWFLLAPFPASIATQAPHAMRAYAFLPTWQIFSAFGLFIVLRTIQKSVIAPVLCLASVLILSMKIFFPNYYGVFPVEQSSSFHFALSVAMPYVLQNAGYYTKVVSSNKDNLYQSYMLFLYYSHFDPGLYQKLGGTKSGGYAQPHVIGNREFHPLDSEKLQQGILYLANPGEIHGGITIKTFYSKDGSPAIVAKTL